MKGALADAGDEVWQRALSTLQAKGGERKRLTILFADIRDSTSLIDSLGDPELAMRRLQPVLDLMNEAVMRFDGIVNKSQGDGVMAIFGAPRPHEDHAVRGCLAAIAMQDGMVRISDLGMEIRVGVHTGEVVVQAIDHGMYQTYDAAGGAVHLAKRLEQLAEPGGVLVSKETYVAAKQFVEVEPLGPLNIRGISAPVEAFKLKGFQNAPSSGVFRSGRRLSPFLGRNDQFSTLLLELESTVRSDGHVVGVAGDAGIGKSRLCFEFAEHCRGKGIRVFEARVLAHGKATPYQPVLELLRDYFGLRNKDGADILRECVRERLSVLPVEKHFAPILLEFLGLPDPNEPAPKLDPKARKIQLIEFVRTLPRSGPQATSTVVVIEDLHWIDSASLEFVEALADAVVGTKTLLVVNFRPGFVAPLMQRSYYRQVSIPPLAPEQATALLQDYLGTDSSLLLLMKNIVERAQGNPFFMEELINALVERGDFEGERGAYHLRGGIGAIPLPATVQAVVAARIDRLKEDARQVLEVASVIGREISVPVLERVCGLGPTEFSQAVQHLRQSELLYDVAPYEDRLIAFRHPLIQEVTYRSLLHARNRELHAEVAQAIANIFKDRAEELASLLAYHLEQAGENVKAAQQNMRAAVRTGANDPSQALRSWMKVRELLSSQPPSAPIDYLRMMACGQIVNFAWREGISAADALIYFEEAKQFALHLRDMRANALIHAAYGRMLANGGSADEYVRKIREAKAIADEGNDLSVQITLQAVLCHALWLSGHLGEALQMNVEAAQRAHEIAKLDRQTLGFDIDIWLTVLRGRILVMLGRGEEAQPLLDRILRLEAGQVDPLHHIMPDLAYVDLAGIEGNVAVAREHADRAFAMAIKSGSPYLRVYAQASRGLSYIVAGQIGAAIEDLSEALRLARSRKTGLENEPRILADLANAHRLNGDLPCALSTAIEAIRVATERSSRVSECLARIVYATLLLSGKNDQRILGGKELEHAQGLMQETGALIFKALLPPLLDESHQRAAKAN